MDRKNPLTDQAASHIVEDNSVKEVNCRLDMVADNSTKVKDSELGVNDLIA